MSNERQCWYDGNVAAEVWHTTWDDPGEDWPMCAECCASVREALALRVDGKPDAADAIDNVAGIDTRGLAGKWIDPQASSALPLRPIGALTF